MAVKATHTAKAYKRIISYQRVCSVMLWFGIIPNTQAIDVVSFDFKGTRVCCLACGPTDYPMNFV